MKPYSKDLRLRVLAAVDAGKPREEVAKTFSVSMPTIKRWLKRRRETGDVEPKPIPGCPRLKGAALQEWLPSQLARHQRPHSRGASRGFRRAHTGLVVSASTVSRAIERLPRGPWPIKKSQR